MPPTPRAATERSSLLSPLIRGGDDNAGGGGGDAEGGHGPTLDGAAGAAAPPAAADGGGSRRLWQRYRRLLEARPVATKGVTGMLILGAGDLAAQGVERLRGVAATAGTGGPIDGPRALRFAAFGLLGAPWAHYYFQCLDRCLPPTERPCSGRTWLKVGIDQGLQAPLLLAVMVAALGLLRGEGWRQVRADLAAHYWPTLLANWRLWIPFSVLNLAFVKPELRVLFVNGVFFLWTIVLSTMLNAGGS